MRPRPSSSHPLQAGEEGRSGAIMPRQYQCPMVPLGEVHDLINRERESYDRLLLMLLQGSSDLNEKEEEL